MSKSVERNEPSQRRARVSDAGASIFLTPDELCAAFGVDPERINSVRYRVENGSIKLDGETVL